MFDRLGQLMPRLGASRGRLASDGFTELQIGYCTLTLQRALPTLPPNVRPQPLPVVAPAKPETPEQKVALLSAS